MSNETLIKAYRKKLINLHSVTVGVVSVIEIVAYLVFVGYGAELFSIHSVYFKHCVILPIALNVLVHIITRYLTALPKFSHLQKNAFVLYATMTTAFIVSLVHRQFVIASCSVVFPMILSAHFNDRKLLVQSLVISFCTLILTAAVVYFERGRDAVYLINYLALCGFCAVAFFSAIVTIDNSELNLFVIENQALTNKRLRNKLKKDPMTDLYNHKTFHDELASAISGADLSGTGFYVAMLDIDDFKQINDTFGHDDGDVVLASLAKIIKHNSKSTEIAFRYGGEEFAIIIKRSSVDAAIELMKKILCDFSSVKFQFRKEPVTFSCGLATFRCGMTKAEIFDRADDGMYVAKKNGKNRIYCCEKEDFV